VRRLHLRFSGSPSATYLLLTCFLCSVIQSMLGEITDETNQAQGMWTVVRVLRCLADRGRIAAFPLSGMIWNIGCILGPSIGGSLSHPAERYPILFGDIELLRRYVCAFCDRACTRRQLIRIALHIALLPAVSCFVCDYSMLYHMCDLVSGRGAPLHSQHSPLK
jgi:MFS family permease